nr:MAG TPA: hypothetical protein [Microviridae sp.]
MYIAQTPRWASSSEVCYLLLVPIELPIPWNIRVP